MSRRRNRSKGLADARWRDAQRENEKARKAAKLPEAKALDQAVKRFTEAIGALAPKPKAALGKVVDSANALTPKPDLPEVIVPVKYLNPAPDFAAQVAAKIGIDTDTAAGHMTKLIEGLKKNKTEGYIAPGVELGVDLAKGDSETVTSTVTVSGDGTGDAAGYVSKGNTGGAWNDNHTDIADPNFQAWKAWGSLPAPPYQPALPEVSAFDVPLETLEAIIAARKAKEGKAAAPVLPATPPEPSDPHHREVDV